MMAVQDRIKIPIVTLQGIAAWDVRVQLARGKGVTTCDARDYPDAYDPIDVPVIHPALQETAIQYLEKGDVVGFLLTADSNTLW